MPHNPDKLMELASELEKPFERYLKWATIVDRYERGKGSKLAVIISGLEKGSKESYASLEQRALASQEYQTYLDEWHNADKERATARILYETKRCQFDALQSVLAYERDSMRRLG